ncbi:hypothetical protein AZ14_1463, partial [Bordetella bronchiseptica 980]
MALQRPVHPGLAEGRLRRGLARDGLLHRLGIASSAAGWALLACLPEAERDYLLRARPHAPAEPKSDWNPMRRHANEAILQVRNDGFCVALGES